MNYQILMKTYENEQCHMGVHVLVQQIISHYEINVVSKLKENNQVQSQKCEEVLLVTT